MRRSERLASAALFLCLLLALPHQSWASTSQRIPVLVDKYAARYGIPLSIARNLVRAESGGRQSAQSPAGARGVMQLTPATARALGVDMMTGTKKKTRTTTSPRPSPFSLPV